MNLHYGETGNLSLLHFRLRSARQRKRQARDERDRQLLALNRELRALYSQKNSLGWLPLHPPVVRGWKRSFALRADVARSKDVGFFENILKKINTTQFSYRKDFRIKKRKGGKKIYVARPQELWQPEIHQFNRLEFTEEEKNWFSEISVMTHSKRQMALRYVFKERWRFVLRVDANIVSKTRVRNEEIESRIQIIRNYLERNDLNKRLYHLTDGHYNRRREDRKSEKNPLTNKPMTDILQMDADALL